jgi:hypothetical protein
MRRYIGGMSSLMGKMGEFPFGDSEELIFDFGITQEIPRHILKLQMYSLSSCLVGDRFGLLILH